MANPGGLAIVRPSPVRSKGRRERMMVEDRLELINRIERHALDAWPAAQRDDLFGWQMRFAYGITRRANSVWPNGEFGPTSLAEALNEAELFYAIYEMPARFQISPASLPSDLDIMLALRGYQSTAKTAVKTATIASLLAKTGRRLPASGFAVDVVEQFSEPWFQTYSTVEQFGPREAAVRRDIVQRIRLRTGYALAIRNDETAAVGLGVIDDDLLGISCMTTHEHMRRRGAATTVLNAMAAWAQGYGVKTAYLQVMLVNAQALPLYRVCGFSDLYSYHYREKAL